MLRRYFLVIVIFGLLCTGRLPAQGLLGGVDLSGPAMTEADLTRDEVATLLAAGMPGHPADLSRLRLKCLDLTGSTSPASTWARLA